MKIILRCLTVTCLFLFSVPALADDVQRSQTFLMFNAGTLNVAVMQLQFNDPIDPNDDVLEPTSIIEERSLGTLGRAELKTFARVTGEVPHPDQCPNGFPIPLVITDDAIVLTFHDLSQLAGNVRTVVCIEPGGTQGIRGEGNWSSGSRRFADVTGGEFRLTSTAERQSTNGQFYTTVGAISGRLHRQ